MITQGNPRSAQVSVSSEPPEKQFRTLETIVRTLQAGFLAVNEALTTLSFALMLFHDAVAAPVAVSQVAAFLNAVGQATVAAGIPDVQFFVQERTSKAPQDLKRICGAVIDIDEPTADVLTEVERAGVPYPTAYFNTRNGYKLVRDVVADSGTNPRAAG